MSFILGGKHALHDHLIGAPIPDAENRRAEENPRPGKVRIAHGLDHVEVAGGQGSAQAFEPAHLVHSDHGQDDGAENQDEGLHQVGINDRGQSSGDSVNTGGDDQNHRRCQRAPAHHTLQHNRGSVEVHGNLGEYIGQDGNSRQVHGAGPAEAPLQKFRHGEDVGAQIKRDEDPTQDQQDQASQPFK